MPQISFFVTVELDRKFRNEVSKRYGYKKGNLQKAFIEALENWIGEGKIDSESGEKFK